MYFKPIVACAMLSKGCFETLPLNLCFVGLCVACRASLHAQCIHLRMCSMLCTATDVNDA